MKTDTGDENEIKDSNLMDPKLDRKVLEDDLRIFRQFRKFAGEDLMTQHELEGEFCKPKLKVDQKDMKEASQTHGKLKFLCSRLADFKEDEFE